MTKHLLFRTHTAISTYPEAFVKKKKSICLENCLFYRMLKSFFNHLKMPFIQYMAVN